MAANRPEKHDARKRLGVRLRKNLLSATRCLLVVCAAGLMTTAMGCRRDPAAELKETPWRHIEVAYLAGDKTVKPLASWSTDNEADLDDLRAALVVTYSGELWNVPTMTTNRILIRLGNGRDYIMHIYEPHLLSVYDKNETTVSFSLRVDPSFVRVLKARIEAETNEKAYFHTYHED